MPTVAHASITARSVRPVQVNLVRPPSRNIAGDSRALRVRNGHSSTLLITTRRGLLALSAGLLTLDAVQDR